MGKIRVYELAKDLNVESKKIINILAKKGVVIKNHMGVLDENHIFIVKSELTGGGSTEFKPKVTRIPKAVVEAEAAAKAPEEPKVSAPEVEEVKMNSEVKVESDMENKTEVKITQQENKRQAEPAKPETPAPVKPEIKPEDKPRVIKETKPYVSKEAPPRGGKPDFKPNTGSNPVKKNFNNPNGNRDNRPANNNQRKPGDNRPNNNNNKNYQPAAKPGPKPAATGGLLYTNSANTANKPPARRNETKKYDSKPNTFVNSKKALDKKRFGHDDGKYRGRPRNKNKDRKPVVMPPVMPKKVVIGETIIVQELAKSMSKTASELIKKLFEMGIMATINQELDADTAILLADEFGVTVEVKQEKVDEILEDDTDNPRDLKERPPVVTVMGHVDHGKTSLLDAIRKTSVTTTEAGGITQHIGAYQVEIQGKKITFLDTPGHEAFTSMRARGAQVTDISILVVAADDGVMPQTVEAINHSKAAKVPIIVAINKIDKPGANPDRVKQELAEHGIVCEDWGGDVIMVPVSAKQRMGLDTLLEMVLLVAEVEELKANSKRRARGTVIEAKLDRARGPVATLLVQKGTLKIGETIVAGSVFGKVRAMSDDKNRTVKSAGPSMPVEILGFSEVPPPGEIFIAIKDEKDARYAAQIQSIKKREEEMRKSSRVSLDDLFKHISDGDVKELNIVIKADVQGSAEAVRQSLENLSTGEVKVSIIHVGVGAISESDVMLADASNAIIIGFNVRPDAQTRKAAEAASVDMRLYRVIYDAIEDVKKAMVGLLEPEFKEKLLGHVEVRDIFRVPKIGVIAGCHVSDGKITNQSEVRIVRDGIVVFEGKISSLRRFKDDVKEVLTGFECGIGIENFSDIKEGDVIEAFIMEETERELV